MVHVKLKKVKHPYVPGSTTVRPYVVGYGCDGSTDANIHYVAQKMALALGWDYAEIYASAYPDDRGRGWIEKDMGNMKDESLHNRKVKHTTIIPNDTTIQNVLDDLYDINNRSLVMEFEERLEKAGIPLSAKIKDLSSPNVAGNASAKT